MTEPYGPFKPAFLTVKAEKFERQFSADGMPLLDAPRMEQVGITDWEWAGRGRWRLTFRDDWAAAEFALRYA